MAQYFSHSELACKCCGKESMKLDFLDLLDKLRELYRRPIILTSAYRCSKHNQAVSTTGPSGPHTTGCAVDVKCSGSDAYKIVSLAIQLGFTGIGVRQSGDHASRFIHLDTLTGNTRPWVWTY